MKVTKFQAKHYESNKVSCQVLWICNLIGMYIQWHTKFELYKKIIYLKSGKMYVQWDLQVWNA